MSPPHYGVTPPNVSDEEISEIAAENAERQERQAEIQTNRDRLRHPVMLLMREVAGGSTPSGSTLDNLEFGTADRRRLEAAISELAGLRDQGLFGEADKRYDALAFAVIDGLPAHQQVSTYLEADDEDDGVLDPDALAERVNGQW